MSEMQIAVGLGHRNLMPDAPDFHPFGGSDLFDRVGGQQAVDSLVDRLYDGIEHDAMLRPLFPRDLAHSRAMQKLFIAEWLGGPARYGEEAHAGIRQRHDDVPSTLVLAGHWLGHFRHALDVAVPDRHDREAISRYAYSLATALVSQQPRRRPSATPVAWSGVDARILTGARQLAHRGDADGLSETLAEAPELLKPSFAAAIMQSAVSAGQTEIVRTLLGRGVGPDGAFYLPVGTVGLAFERVLFVTPLCAARMKRRTEVESLLRAAGAHDDVFTAAFLGDVSSVERMLQADPDLAVATDPMVDILDITAAEHAVAGRQLATLQIILNRVVDRAGEPRSAYVRALRGAAAQENVAMVELLLAAGADATRIGVGRWVLHPELAPLLAGRGAAVDASGSWIGACCTGNQGRKDDPEYVRALLRHGAQATDRRTGVPGETGVGALNATALHYAAKAGFLQTIKVLLENGADPYAMDSRGRTPLDWLDQAAPSVQRTAVRSLIQSGRVS